VTDAGPGGIFIEAEDHDRTGSLDDEHRWSTETVEPGHRGSGYIRAQPIEENTICELDELDDCGAFLEYDFTVTAPGTYWFHYRTFARAGGEDSLHWAVDAEELETLFVGHGAWVWTVGASPQTLAAGRHTLKIWMRENGLRLDQIFISTSGSPP